MSRLQRYCHLLKDTESGTNFAHAGLSVLLIVIKHDHDAVQNMGRSNFQMRKQNCYCVLLKSI